jgi:hypothetical protein
MTIDLTVFAFLPVNNGDSDSQKLRKIFENPDAGQQGSLVASNNQFAPLQKPV